MSYTALIVGCGMIGGLYEDPRGDAVYSHGKAYAQSGNFSRTGFYDVDLERAQKLAQKFQGEAYSHSLEETLKILQPDVVSVCTPDNTHFEVLKSLLENRSSVKIIFAEKPLCQTKQELELLLVLQQQSRIPIIVNHSRRFDEGHRRLKALVQSQDLGALVRADIDYYGGWIHLGVHIVDLLLYLFKEDLVFTRASYYCASKYQNDPTLNIEARLGDAFVRFSGFEEEYYQLLEMSLKFQKGLVKINDFGQEILVFNKTVNQETENVLVLNQVHSSRGMQNPMINAVKVIEDFLKTNDTSILTPYSLVQAQNTMNALWRGKGLYESQN